MTTNEARVRVDYEYGRLREVIVGGAYGLYPDVAKAVWIEECQKILPKAEVKKALARSGKDFKEVGKYDRLECENRELIKILEANNVKVWRPTELSVEQVAVNFGADYVRTNGFQFVYARDPIAVIGEQVIELSMGSAMRRADILAYRTLLMTRVKNSNARWFAMPGIDYCGAFAGSYDKTRFPALEGGDILLLGQKILVGTSKNPMVGSSPLGVAWLQSILGPLGYDVEAVPLQDQFLHLDVALSIPRPGLIIACPAAFCNGVPAYFKGWKVIAVSLEDAQRLAVNGLPIDENHYILGANGPEKWERIAEALSAEGIEVYSVPFENHNEDGGSIRCATHPLLRD